ncbi:MAG: hypothetical protein MI757_19530 [Pirellulales bacterium]|nr:hypothetical protein [Pirellulales bacterium]
MGLFDVFSRPPTEAKYAAMIISRLQQANFPHAATYDAGESAIRFTDAEGEPYGIVNLANFYGEFCRLERNDREQHTAHVVQNLLTIGFEVPKEFDDAKPDLLPSVRTAAYYSLSDLQTQIEHEKPIVWPRYEMNQHLAASLVYDLPGSMMAVTEDNLEDWDVSIYEAMEAAKQNLQEREFTFASIGDGLYCSATGDSYDASRMLLLDLIQNFEVDGDTIAMVCNRDNLYVTGSDDFDSQAIMLELAEKTFEEPRPMNWFVYRLVDGEWQWWRPPADNPHLQQFKLFEARSWHGEYTEQQDLLNHLHADDENAPFVASLMVGQNDATGEITTTCCWSPLRILLTQADRVAFVAPTDNSEDGEVVAMATWDRVQQVVGHLMKPLDYYPPRFEVSEFPSGEQIAQLGMIED